MSNLCQWGVATEAHINTGPAANAGKAFRNWMKFASHCVPQN